MANPLERIQRIRTSPEAGQQGYLAHKKPPPPRGPYRRLMPGPLWRSGGLEMYKQGTPVSQAFPEAVQNIRLAPSF